MRRTFAGFLFAACTLLWLPLATAAPAMHSSFVTVHAHKLHIVVAGHGAPVVVLEAGFSSDSNTWRVVQPRLAKVSTVFAYDRAGLGKSEPDAGLRSARRIAADLEAALKAADLPPPYVLVAHSAGALYIREFAYLYPSAVTGIVFVDPAPPAYYAWFERHAPKAWKRLAAEAAASSPGAKQELEALDTSIAQAEHAWPLPDVPVYLLVATRLQPPIKNAQGLKVWVSMQKKFCRRLKQCMLIEDPRSFHDMPYDDPGLIVKSVERIIRHVRQPVAP